MVTTIFIIFLILLNYNECIITNNGESKKKIKDIKYASQFPRQYIYDGGSSFRHLPTTILQDELSSESLPIKGDKNISRGSKYKGKHKEVIYRYVHPPVGYEKKSLEALQKQLDTLTEENKNLKNENKLLSEKLQSLKDVPNKCEDQFKIKKYKSDYRKCKDELKTLKKLKTQKSTDTDRLVSENSDLKSQLEKLKMKLVNIENNNLIKSNLENQNRDNVDLNRELVNCKSQNQDLQNEIKEVNKKLDEVKITSKQELQMSTQILQNNFIQKEKELNDIINKNKVNVQNMSEEISKLRTDLLKEQTIKNKDKEVFNLNKVIEELNNKNKICEEKVVNLENEIGILQQKNLDLSNNLSNVQLELDHTKEKVIQTKELLETEKSKTINLESLYNGLNEKHKQALDEIKVAKTNIEQGASSELELKSSLLILENQLKEANYALSQSERLKSEGLSECERISSELRTQIKILESQLVDTTSVVNYKLGEIESLKQKVNECTIKSSEIESEFQEKLRLISTELKNAQKQVLEQQEISKRIQYLESELQKCRDNYRNNLQINIPPEVKQNMDKLIANLQEIQSLDNQGLRPVKTPQLLPKHQSESEFKKFVLLNEEILKLKNLKSFFLKNIYGKKREYEGMDFEDAFQQWSTQKDPFPNKNIERFRRVKSI
ncbi:uncharacterized protein CMU_035310 [Cryptosporidium muris RN66]|uniref:Uncharacterized protein n=1 Tax=Cryptosporidium muris (strain RN66) TaxID=441375 RepID=B6AGL9_CRYMR|nr:uncharacterized protein CMU_035310 [Cryptosporidium muris RN66]EEA07360.1 hypothetical protein, conserved [Cryptosporidium muris RN66]|eukprot:XP_002141709.1 hypothetical protein [Cryptosporidium muris RN66]